MSSTDLLSRYPRIGLVLLVTVVFSSQAASSGWDARLFRPITPRNKQILLRSLSLSKLPDVPKMNVSQEEFETKFQEYERRVRETRSIDDMTTFHSLRHSDQSRRLSVDFNWARNFTKDVAQGSRIRVFVEGSFNSKLEIRTGRTVEWRNLNDLPKWMDINSGTEWWKYQLLCKDCHISRASVYIHAKKEGYRNRRNSERVMQGMTDCKEHHYTDKKRTCCRHQMQVVFSELPGYEYILQPFSFDAGYCKGGCPRGLNQYNHASIQSLLWTLKKGDAPKPCCAPSKLEPLEILHLDESDPTKLRVSKWHDMKVIGCICF